MMNDSETPSDPSTKHAVEPAEDTRVNDPVINRRERKSIGEYVLVRKIGGGGMGVVYEAQHRRLKRRVAVKVISESYLLKPGASRRFFREMEAAGKLEHRHIVRATDAGVADGVPYLVMEYISGSDLFRLVKRCGFLPPLAALEVIRQAAEALAHIHGHGMVHRDIKPSNLLLSEKGDIKIADLGLAHLANSFTEIDEVTATGDIVGTVEYMAPEQARDARLIDPRSDIYSLGCCFHFLNCGAPVFRTDSRVDCLIAHGTREIPELVSRYGIPLPKSVNSLFQDMLAKKPENRPQSVEEVLRRLEKCQDDLSDFLARLVGKSAVLVDGKSLAVDAGLEAIARTLLADGAASVEDESLQTTVQFRRKPTKVLVRLVAIACGLLAMGLGLYFARDHWLSSAVTESHALLDAPATPSDAFAFNAHPGAVFNVHFTEDGQHVVSCGSDGTVRVWDVKSRLQTGQMQHERGPHGVHVIDVALIPNTPLAVSVCYSGIATVWNWQESRPLRQFTDHRNQVEGVAWISGTKILTTGRDDSMYIWDVNSGEVVARLENTHAGGVRAVAVRPNGRQAITADYTGKIALWNVETGNEQLEEILQPISETHEIWSIAWVADTPRIAVGGLYSSGKSLLVVVDIESGDIVREFTQLTGRVYGVGVSRDGKYLFSAADSVAGWSLDAESKDARPLFEFKRHNDNAFSVDESPDGTLLATGGTDGRVWIFPWRRMTALAEN